MKAQEFDYYPIKKYTFAVNKTNNFFSVATIIVSLCIIVVSIIISFSTVSQLWLPLSSLPIKSSLSLAFPENPLTSTVVCVQANSPSPYLLLYDSKSNPISITSVPISNAPQQFQRLSQLTPSLHLSCFNLQGLFFQPNNYLFYLQIIGQHPTIYIDGSSQQEIINLYHDQPIKVIPFPSTSPHMQAIQISIIQSVIYNSLYLNYEPQSIITINKVKKSSVGNVPFPSNSSFISLSLFYPDFSNLLEVNNYCIHNIFVQRLNIAIIIGSVLSWISIFAIICGFVASPLMSYALSIIQAQSLFHVQQRNQKPSILKFVIASLKKGIFSKEDRFVQLCGKLDELKDVSYILKIQKTVKQLSPPSNQPKITEVFVSQHSFDQQLSKGFGVDVFSEIRKEKSKNFVTSEDLPKEGVLVRLRKGLLFWLDSGCGNISVSYSGKGHGSKESLLVSVCFAAGFLVLLFLFGVFKFSTVVSTDDTINNVSYTFSRSEIIMSTPSNKPLSFNLVDEEYNIIGPAPFIMSNSCLSRVPENQIQSVTNNGPYYYCLSDSLTLFQTKNSGAIKLNINNTQVIQAIQFFYIPLPSFPQTIFFKTINLPPGDPFNNVMVAFYTIKITDDQTNRQKYPQFLPISPFIKNLPLYNALQGVIFTLSDLAAVTTTIQGTFFDLVQNVWSLGMVCFTVILAKLTKYINLRKKSASLGEVKAQFRDSLCIMLSRVHELVNGRHAQQLSKSKYYLKKPLHDQF